jgi:hypothetical protein
MRASRGMRRLVLMCLLLLPLSALAAGCGKGGTVSGKIYYKGQPVTGGTVYFFPEGTDSNYRSLIERDGSYKISELPRGPAKISVVVGMKGPPPGVMNRMGGQAAAKGIKQMERIGKSASGGGEQSGNAAGAQDNTSVPEKYTDPEKSGLTIDVTGSSQKFDIKME